jgi:cell division protein FtsB
VHRQEEYDETTEQATPSPWAHRMLFFILVTLAFFAYAPAVLLPVLREYSAVLAEQRRLNREIEDLETQVQRMRRMATAFKEDPDVNERLAQIDLRYRRPDEEIVPIPPPLDAEFDERPVAADAEDALVPPHWPVWAHQWEQTAREWGLVRVYLDPSARVVLLLMAGGLVIAAFVLYAPAAPDDEDETYRAAS